MNLQLIDSPTGHYYRSEAPAQCPHCQTEGKFEELRYLDLSVAGWVCLGCGHIAIPPRRLMAYDTYSETCPYCKTPGCEADWVDVDVGLIQCGPFHCENCGASQVGPQDKNVLTEEEKRTGWFKPGQVGTSANTVQGVHVDHKTAKQLYDAGLLDNPKVKEAQIKQNS